MYNLDLKLKTKGSDLQVTLQIEIEHPVALWIQLEKVCLVINRRRTSSASYELLADVRDVSKGTHLTLSQLCLVNWLSTDIDMSL